MEIEHVHFYVENAKTWRNWFVNILGFEVVDDYIISSFLLNKQKNGQLDTCTEVVKSGSIYFVLSSALSPTSTVAEFLQHHPPGVADIAFIVEDVEDVILRANAYGVRVLEPISHYQRDGIDFKLCKIAAWGSLSHTLIEIKGVNSKKLKLEEDTRENLSCLPSSYSFFSTPLETIDHIVLNVAAGKLKHAVAWYKEVLDFQPQQVFNIQTEYSALHSQVMVSRSGTVWLPINEPTTTNSQIQEFLDANKGAGIQHIALRSNNLIDAISQFRSQNLPFLSVDQTYYSELVNRIGFPLVSSEIHTIAQQEILVDWQQDNPEAVLLQIFTQPIFRQPTFFFEFIERRNLAKGFGEGNFRALFEAIEREQLKRGSLY